MMTSKSTPTIIPEITSKRFMEKCYQKDIYIGVVDMDRPLKAFNAIAPGIAGVFAQPWKAAGQGRASADPRWNDSVDYRIDQYVRWIKTNALPPDAKNGTPLSPHV
jgi:hypothetical protein